MPRSSAIASRHEQVSNQLRDDLAAGRYGQEGRLPSEAQLARRIAPGSRVQVIPNGVDADYFKPAPEACREPAVIFTGDMSYFPNEEAVIYFAHQVLQLLAPWLRGDRAKRKALHL